MSAGAVTESFATQPMQEVIPAYLYDQYNDDENLQAFIDAYNAMAQGYLDWFLTTNLAAYTSGQIAGPLLDWSANNIYGVMRPVISTSSTRITGAINSRAINTMAINRLSVIQSGTAQVATDDIYKRTLTWVLCRGFEGTQMSIAWLKKRIARFLYGVNGADVSVADMQYISIAPTMYRPSAGISSHPINTRAINTLVLKTVMAIHLHIVLPDTLIARTFAAMLNQGLLPMPTQITWTVSFQ